MKAHGIGTGDQTLGTAQPARRELLLAGNQIAVGSDEDLPGVADAVAPHIAVVGALDTQVPAFALIGKRPLRVERADQRRVRFGLRAFARDGELGQRVVLEAQGRVRWRRARIEPPFLELRCRRPAIDDDRRIAGAHLEGQEARMGVARQRCCGRRSEIAQDQSRAGLDAHIAGIRGRADRRAVDVIIGTHRGQGIGRRRTGSVEAGHRTVAEPEEAQHRHDAVDRVRQLLGRRTVACHEALAQRQQIEQQFDQCFGIARDMSAVWQDLALELAAKRLGVAIHHGLLVGDAKPAVEQRHERQEPRHAVGRIPVTGGQIAKLRGECLEEGLVGFGLACIENENRVGQPRNHAPGDDLRLPGQRRNFSP